MTEYFTNIMSLNILKVEDPLALLAATTISPPLPPPPAPEDSMDTAFAETMRQMRARGSRSLLERKAEHAFMDGSPSLFCWSHLEVRFV